MPHPFDFDRILRHYDTLTPAQRDAVVRLVVGAAKEARAQSMRRALFMAGAWLRKGAVRASGALRPLGAAVLGLTANVGRRYTRWRRRRLAAARLHSMDDRMLKDIGLNRGDIEFVLSGAPDPTRIARASVRRRDPLASLRPKPQRQPARRFDPPLDIAHRMGRLSVPIR